MCREKFGEFGGIGLLAMLRNDTINDVDYLGLMSMQDWGKPQMPGLPRFDPYDPDRPTIGLPRLEPYDPYKPPTIGPADPYRTTRRADQPDTPFMPWSDRLPDCPPKIPLDECGQPEPARNGWSDPTPANDLHPGAKWEIRWTSGRWFGSGQQCTYDKDGNLITTPPAAGTPDMCGFDPNGPWYENAPHLIFDVIPFFLLPNNLYFDFWKPNGGRL